MQLCEVLIRTESFASSSTVKPMEGICLFRCRKLQGCVLFFFGEEEGKQFMVGREGLLGLIVILRLADISLWNAWKVFDKCSMRVIHGRAPIKLECVSTICFASLKVTFSLNKQVPVIFMKQVSIYSSRLQFTRVSTGDMQSVMVSITMIWNLSLAFESTRIVLLGFLLFACF